ncbi:prepilin-type N-terminal cleavage/methylation domain-containing protein, partial [Caldimonas thermodepolymerans]
MRRPGLAQPLHERQRFLKPRRRTRMKQLRPIQRVQQGFTLIELMIV